MSLYTTLYYLLWCLSILVIFATVVSFFKTDEEGKQLIKQKAQAYTFKTSVFLLLLFLIEKYFTKFFVGMEYIGLEVYYFLTLLSTIYLIFLVYLNGKYEKEKNKLEEKEEKEKEEKEKKEEVKKEE